MLNYPIVIRRNKAPLIVGIIQLPVFIFLCFLPLITILQNGILQSVFTLIFLTLTGVIGVVLFFWFIKLLFENKAVLILKTSGLLFVNSNIELKWNEISKFEYVYKEYRKYNSNIAIDMVDSMKDESRRKLNYGADFRIDTLSVGINEKDLLSLLNTAKIENSTSKSVYTIPSPIKIA
jgi:hypothetical protein